MSKLIPIFICLLICAGCNSDKGEDLVYTYSSNSDEWLAFLQCWEKQTVNKLSKQEQLYTDYEKKIFNNKSQSFPSASNSDLDELSKKLKTTLPKSYTDFLSASNGWIQLELDAEDGMILHSKEVALLINKYPDWYKTWSQSDSDLLSIEYLDEYDEQDTAMYPASALKNSIAISELVDSGLYLLVPNAKNNEDRWEAWFMSSELPGAVRFPNFEYLMKFAYYRSIKNEELNSWIVQESFSQLISDCE